MTIRAVLVRFVDNEDGGTTPHYVIEQLEAIDQVTLLFMAEDAAEGLPYLCLSPTSELVLEAQATGRCLYAAAGFTSINHGVTYAPVLVFFTVGCQEGQKTLSRVAFELIPESMAWVTVVPYQF